MRLQYKKSKQTKNNNQNRPKCWYTSYLYTETGTYVRPWQKEYTIKTRYDFPTEYFILCVSLDFPDQLIKVGYIVINNTVG